MQCEEIRDHLAELLRGELPATNVAAMRVHIASCALCAEETRGLEALWAALDEIPADPLPRGSRARFEQMLDASRTQADPVRWSNDHSASRRFGGWSPLLQAGAAAALLLLGVWLGRVSRPAPAVPASELIDVRRELQSVREMLALSLLQQPSATERLRGVDSSNQIGQPGTEVLSALVDTLLHDPNVNVRLSVVDALRRFTDRPVVREGTVQALKDRQFPMVQVALIDFLVDIKDTSAVRTLQELSSDSVVNESVRSRAAWALERLGS